MRKPPSTNSIRRIIEEGGVEKPSRRAVEMVAVPIDNQGGQHLWELRFTPAHIIAAAQQCKGLTGEASYQAFRKALQS